MKLIIQEYLKHLGERKELEVVLVNLMNAMRLTVLSEPGVGTKQGGVDVLAVGRMPGDSVRKVFLLTAKSGDIDRCCWNSGAQALRPSLDEIVDGYINSSLREDLKDLPKVICVCFGGVVKEPVRQEFNGHIKNLLAANRHLRLEILEWNGSELAGLVERHLMRSEAFVGEGRRWLVRALGSVEDPATSFKMFVEFLRATQIAMAKASLQKKVFRLYQVGMCLALLEGQCREAGNLDSAYLCAERTILWTWDFLGIPEGAITAQNQKKTTAAFEVLWLQYVSIAQKYFGKLERVVEPDYAFSVACHGGCEIDVNKRLFDVLGRAASFGSGFLWYMTQRERDLEMSVEAKASADKVLLGVVQFVEQLIAKNPTSHSPVLDEFGIEISLTALFLLQMNESEFLCDWLDRIVFRQELNFGRGCAYPVNGLRYEDLHEHEATRHDESHLKKVLGESILCPIMAYVFSVCNRQESFNRLRNLRNAYFPQTNLQMWFPDAISEQNIYADKQVHGLSLTGLSMDDMDHFRSQVFEECDVSPFNFSCYRGSAFTGLLLMACRCYRYPVPPQLFKAYYEARVSTHSSTDAELLKKQEQCHG